MGGKYDVKDMQPIQQPTAPLQLEVFLHFFLSLSPCPPCSQPRLFNETQKVIMRLYITPKWSKKNIACIFCGRRESAKKSVAGFQQRQNIYPTTAHLLNKGCVLILQLSSSPAC